MTEEIFYRILWQNESYGWEKIDTAESSLEAEKLIDEYAVAFHSRKGRFKYQRTANCPDCNSEMNFDLNCACLVCPECQNHFERARCWCGWSKSGRDGRKELRWMGETIEPDDPVGSGHIWD